ncbi:hypothetical protein ABEH94_06040 [Pantoea agglomerans]|uniref:hypothetical protein n=1 Tax=Enterobacter agglomerans TaxID=549 RepID=UPI00320B0976
MKNKVTFKGIIVFLTILISSSALYFYGTKHNWALSIILILIPVVGGSIVFYFLNKNYHEALKKFSESLIAIFSLISYGYYIYSISQSGVNTSLATIYSSILGYLFLTIISYCGVIKLLLSLKEFKIERAKLNAEKAESERASLSTTSINTTLPKNVLFISIRGYNNDEIHALIEKDNKIEITIKK